MKVSRTELPDILLIEPDIFRDQRGFFMETWRQPCYEQAGIPGHFVQGNLSFSHKGVLREIALHNEYGRYLLETVLGREG